MKVILIEDDVRLGDKGAMVEVKRGFAVNFLIPQKKAVIATAGSVSMMQNELRMQTKKFEKEKAEHKKVADKIADLTLEYKVKAAITGHLYGTITNQDVVDQIKEKTGIELSKKQVALSTHIKTEGRYSVAIKLFSGINVTLPVIVVTEKIDEDAAS